MPRDKEKGEGQHTGDKNKGFAGDRREGGIRVQWGEVV